MGYFRKINEYTAISSDGFAVRIKREREDNYRIYHTEKGQIFSIEAQLGDKPDILILKTQTLKRIDNPYPDGIVHAENIFNKVIEGIEFLQKRWKLI